MPTYYATVEDVRDALEEKATAYDTTAILRALAQATDDVDDAANLAGGCFRPVTATRYYRWPDAAQSNYYRLWLDGWPLLSVTTLTSGGDTVPGADYFLEPQQYGPPYNRIEIDLSSSSAWSSGDSAQRSIAVAGLWGVGDDRETVGTLASAIASTSATTAVVSNAASVGIGDHLVIDSERFVVTARAWTSTTATTSGTPTASMADRAIGLDDGTKVNVGEILLIDSERVKVVDIVGNTATVVRAVDGSVLASHGSGVTAYAQRSLTVSRGAQGSTAATHLISATVERHVVPGAVQGLAVGSAVAFLLGERRGWAGGASKPSTGQQMAPGSLAELRDRVAGAYGRQIRARAV